MSLQFYKKEFEDAIKEVTITAALIKEPLDRIQITEWIKKLLEIPSDSLANAVLKNEYIQFLRIALNNEIKLIFAPFNEFPPKDDLISLAKYLGDMVVESSSSFPDGGPIQPILCHKTEDSTASLTIQRCSEGGIFCYMSVAPNNLE